MKKAFNKTVTILTLLVSITFLMDSCGPTYVRTKRPVVYRPAPTRVVVAPVPVVVVKKYSPPPRPNRTVVKVRF
ncbi:MAG: hypothetical protein RLZZ306_25 [Bacteroidota bacterium]